MKTLKTLSVTAILIIFTINIHCECCKGCRTRTSGDNESTNSTTPIKTKNPDDKKTKVITPPKVSDSQEGKASTNIIEVSEKIDSDEQKSEDLKSINSGDSNSRSYKYSHLTQEKFNNLDNKNNEEPIVQNDADNKNGSDTEINKNLCERMEEPDNSDNESDENLNITEESPENSQKVFMQVNLKLDIEKFFKISSSKAKKISGQIIHDYKNYINKVNKEISGGTYSINAKLKENFSIIIEYKDKKEKEMATTKL